jgi:hypothetical protein
MFKSSIVISNLDNVEICCSLPSTSNEKYNAKGKVIFVFVVVDKDKKFACDNGVSKPKSFPSNKKQPTTRFVPTCYHCDKVGDIRPKCIKLRPHEHVNENPSPRNDHEGCSK